ncbi:MAG: imidazolonepropionase [Colwellia sp.]|nr:imidazolonepropionase [Colwellia sp.]
MTLSQATNTQCWQTLYLNVNLATMTDGANSYGEITDAALAINEGKISWIGKQVDLPEYSKDVDVIDGNGQWLSPGLIDCHTHLVYGGNRANEFEMRLQGKSYQEIANAGGGIVSTVTATRKASEEVLLAAALPRLQALHSQGVTTLEIKSGYGLDTPSELKMLKVADRLSEKLPVTIKKTFLGAHALPTEYKDDPDGYLDKVCNEMLPAVVEKKLADAVDVFCEGIGFSLEQTKRVFDAAQSHGLPIKVHAEQLSNLGASELAANYDALSSDHIEFLDEAGIKAMKKSGMTAVLLPGAFYFLRETQLPPIELLRKYDVPMAVATDANPGTSPIHNIHLMLNMACTLFKLTPAEALAGITCYGAKALGLAQSKGQLAVGFDADIARWNINQPAELCYQFGVNPLTALVQNGQRVI